MHEFIGNLNCRPPATQAGAGALESKLGMRLPDEYQKFLKIANGAEGLIGKNAYVVLWGVEELLEMNKVYEVESNAPGLLIFGSDGGGEAYGFDMRNPQ